jgi:5-methyltetrahydrofolate--homocysteine methyltransferase
MNYLDAVAQRVVIFDGAMGTSIQERDLTADDFGGPELEGCNEFLVITRPDVVADVHRSFFEVGCDVVETNTFGGTRITLDEYGLGDRTEEINRRAAEIAREVADELSTPEKPRFVAGSMGPGTKLPSLGNIAFAELRDAYQEQARGLIAGGSDLIIIETMMDLLIVKAAMQGSRRAMAELGRELPIQVQVTIETTGRMLVGSEIGAALAALDPMKPDVIGMNCATGPSEMLEHLRHLSRHSRIPISIIPNAGLPHVEGDRTVYDLDPEQLAEWHERFVTEFGVNVIGGCCGTTPAHLQAVVERCADLVPTERTPEHEPSVVSTYSPVPIEQDTSYLIIGERTNANGSKKFREAMLEGDWDTCLQMATEQVREGSHVLDVCVDYVGRDGVADMREIVSRFSTKTTVPLVLDSTEPEVVEAGLELIGGRPILNSANLEDGDAPGSRFDRVCSLARDYGAAVICLLIDEEGQARDLEWKMRVAHQIHDLAVERYGLDPSDLIFDALTFPLSTGDDDLRKDGIATIEAIRRIKAELPGVHTTLGVSNVSFGLKPAARHALNSVFLAECVDAGLDSAIVHASKIRPLNRIDEHQRKVCLDLVWDRREFDDNGNCTYDPLTELLAVFEGVQSVTEVKEDRSGWTVEQRLERRIIDGDRDGLEADLDEALQNTKALEIVNGTLLAGMKVVGELFASGEMQLPFVLQSAETMKMAVAYLEPHMERVDGQTSKGKIVLATVKGDVHDIGKNLVDIIFTNNGYDVKNIGIKQPISEIITAAKDFEADAIGMSGLLVKSTLIMRENLVEMNEQGLSDIPVMLGGAALTRTYVEKDLREVYDGRVFYGKDAFEGLRTMDQLMEMVRSGVDDPEFGTVPTGRQLPAKPKRTEAPVDLPARSHEVVTDNEVFEPPFIGSEVVKGISIDEIAGYVNETALFRNQWQYRPESGETDDEFKTRIRHVFRQELDRAKAEGLLIPQVVYGYYPVNADGDDLVVWDDKGRSEELARFSFPRQTSDPHLCISDFFRPLDSGELDYIAMHIVTMGHTVSERAAKLFEADRYGDYLLLHGLGVEMAEALAEHWHHRIREEWGFADEDGPSLQGLFRQKYRGGRYSFGYPACPDLEDNATIGQLLDADRIGVTCGEDTSWQYQPEQTTSAIICHHPRAKYFVAR